MPDDIKKQPAATGDADLATKPESSRRVQSSAARETRAGTSPDLENDRDADGDSADSEHEESSDRESNERDRPARFTTGKEFLRDHLVHRARQANPRLRSNLVGSVKIHLKDSDEHFLFDWRSEALASGASDAKVEADCVIHLEDRSLLRIAQGDLNPQVAMLSDKIQVDGSASLAIYFFNLVAPASY